MEMEIKVPSHLKLDEQDENGEKYLQEYLHLFRNAIKDLENFTCPTDDLFLLKFLRTKKFNVMQSVKLLHLFFDMKRRTPDISKICFLSLKSIYEKNILVALKKRDDQGRKILYFQSGVDILILLTAMWDPAEVHIDQILGAGFFLFEEMTRSEETQKKGLVVIINGSDLTVRQVGMIIMQLNFAKVKHMAMYLQGRTPVRLKGIHLINVPYIINNVLWAFVKMFMKDKLRRRFHMHGYDTNSLQNFLSPDVLPENLGGQFPLDELEDNELMQNMYNRKDYYKRLQEEYGYLD